MVWLTGAALWMPDGEAVASDLRVNATVSTGNITVGERFTLDFTVTSREPRNVSRPVVQEPEGVRFVSTIPRSTTSYSLVNGVSRMTYRFTYTLVAVDTGAYQIPEIFVNIDGREYASSPLTVVVREQEEDPVTPGIPARPERPELFLELELSENRPVRGQQIIAEIVLYFRSTIDVSTYHVARSWQTEGFWREDLNQSQVRRPESVVMDGTSYRRVVLGRYALFPTRSGELTIPSFAIRATIRQTGRFRDDYSSFFDGFGRQRQIDLETPAKTITTANPPPAPGTGQLISAFGQFSVKRTLSDHRVKLGEAIDVITEISGSGNLGLITRPVYDYPDGFDTHRPRETVDRDKEAPRMSGVKQFRDVLIARNAGRFTIPETIIWVYDDSRRRYVRHQLPALSLEVVRDPNDQVTLAWSDDLRLTPVRGSVNWTKEKKKALHQRWWIWTTALVPLILLFSGFRIRRYRQKLATDEIFYRYEQAARQAEEKLNQAELQASVKTVYSLIYRALSDYITARMKQPGAGFTEKKLIQSLENKLSQSGSRYDREMLVRLEVLLTKCATIRYAPDPDDRDMARDIAGARKLLAELRNHL